MKNENDYSYDRTKPRSSYRRLIGFEPHIYFSRSSQGNDEGMIKKTNACIFYRTDCHRQDPIDLIGIDNKPMEISDSLPIDILILFN